MNNYQKRKFAEYFIKLSSILEIDDWNFQYVVKAICNEFNLKGIDLDKIESRSLRKQNGHIFLSRVILLLKRKVLNLSSVQSLDEKKLNIIAEIYNLSELEKKHVEYYLLVKCSDEISRLNDCVGTSKGYLKMEKILNTKHWIASEINSNLCDKGFFHYHDDDYLNSKILEVFQRKEVRTKNQIKNILLGDAVKSNLTWKDFDYLEKERMIVLNILTNATKNKSKGINILFYGNVGTGKTQLAKLVANKARLDMFEVSSSQIQDNGKKEASRTDRLIDLCSKQNILSSMENSCILFDEGEDAMNRYISSKAYFNKILEETPVPVIWTTNDIYDVDPAFLRRMTYTVEFETLTDDVRLNIWKNILRKNKFKVDYKKLQELNKS